MPVKSYLAYPVRGRRDELAEALRTLRGCEVVSAANREILVVVTDTPDEAAEELLQGALARMSAIDALALVAGFDDTESIRHREARHDPA